jgi:drug/metabolite transporter (DMT)-like permease
MNNTLKAHLAILTANIIYGANFTIAKEVMPKYIYPSGFILLRVAGALSLYWLFSFFFPKEKVERKDLFTLFLCGLFGVAINQLLFFAGLNITTPINAGIVMITTPIMVLIGANVMIKERITIYKLAGIVLGVLGAFLLIGAGKSVSFNANTALGDFFILVNAASFAIYMVMVKPLMAKYQTITVLKYVFLFGFLFVVPFGLPEVLVVDWQNIPRVIWYAILFVVIATTFFAYTLNTYALRILSPSIVSIYIYLQPILAAAIALYYGKDHLTFIKVLSAVMIFLGVYLVSRSPVKEARDQIKR